MARALALLRVKLHGEHSLPGDRSRELSAVIDRADDVGSAIGDRAIRVYKDPRQARSERYTFSLLYYTNVLSEHPMAITFVIYF